MRHRFFAAFSGLLLMTIFPHLVYAENIFEDVLADHPNFEAIQYLKDHSIIQGYEDGTFKPEEKINRAEALKIILLSANFHLLDQENATTDAQVLFTDVQSTDWHFSYIKKAVDLTIVQGYDDGSFKPENTVNMAESLKMILKANDELEGNEDLPGDPFRDVEEDEWFASYAYFFKSYYLLEDDLEGNLHAEKELTRGELSELIYRYIKREKWKKQAIQEGKKLYVYGYATFYGGTDGFNGRGTANGEIFDDQKLTAAHRNLPFNTWIRVYSLKDETKQVEVRINDRGPYDFRFTIDLSLAAFENLTDVSKGMVEIKYEIIAKPTEELL